jgi:hypothetical protein
MNSLNYFRNKKTGKRKNIKYEMIFAVLFSLSLYTFPYLLQRILNRKEKIAPLNKSILSGPFFLSMKTRSACLSIYLLLYSALSLKKDTRFVLLFFLRLQASFSQQTIKINPYNLAPTGSTSENP